MGNGKKGTISIAEFYSKFGIVLIFVILFVVMSIINHNFISGVNLRNVVRQVVVITILACGEQLMLISGMVDLSPGRGEAIYDTTPFRVAAEGDTVTKIEGFKEEAAAWGPSDFRFTLKGNTLYAFMMAVPDSRVSVIKSLTQGEKVRSVRLLGVGEVPFAQNFGVLTVKLPDNMPTEYTNCLAIELDG